MKAAYSRLYEEIIRNCCDEETCGVSRPDNKCQCGVVDILKQIQALDASATSGSTSYEHCSYCDDNADIWWMPETGGLRAAKYCPECGRILEG